VKLERDELDNPALHVYERVCVPLGIELPDFCTVRAKVDPQRLSRGIQTLRDRLEQNRSQFAGSAGVPETYLTRLEHGTFVENTGEILERVASALGVSLPDLYWVVFESPANRRFHAYNVGIGKSGTMSLARIFSRYSSWHEFLLELTMRHVYSASDGEIDDAAMDGYLKSRDRLGNLELDSAGFHATYIERLVRLFPNARFVVTIRDCYSWLDSFLDTMLDFAPTLPDWRFDGFYNRKFGITREVVSSSAKLSAEIPRILDKLLEAWAYPNRRVLAAVPESKRLIVRTSEISESLPLLAAFVGIAEETLDAEESFSNARPAHLRHHLLETIDEQILEESVSRNCADLMRTIFPEHGSSPTLSS
jgi:transcriptional regulator with XRE-family HTH domain